MPASNSRISTIFTVSRIPTTSILTETLSNACWHPIPKYQDTGAASAERAGGLAGRLFFLLRAGRTGSSPQIDRLYVEHHFPLRKRGPHPEPRRAEPENRRGIAGIYFYPGRPFCYYRRVDVSGRDPAPSGERADRSGRADDLFAGGERSVRSQYTGVPAGRSD